MWKWIGILCSVVGVSAAGILTWKHPLPEPAYQGVPEAKLEPSLERSVNQSPWSLEATTNPVDDSRTTIIRQGYKLTGSVLIRCGVTKLDAYFNTPNERSLDTDGLHQQRVRVRYGAKAPIAQTWAVADSFDALFAPSPAAFLNSFASEGKFVIEYKVDGVTDTASFQAADIDSILKESCPSYQKGLAQLSRERVQQKAEQAERKRLCADWKSDCPYASGKWYRSE